MGYLYTQGAARIPPEELPFSRFLASQGAGFSVVQGLLQHTIIRYAGKDGSIREETIYAYTRQASYAEAWEKMRSLRSQVILSWGKEDQEVPDRFVRQEDPETVL
jgi:hypothetical protein